MGCAMRQCDLRGKHAEQRTPDFLVERLLNLGIVNQGLWTSAFGRKFSYCSVSVAGRLTWIPF